MARMMATTAAKTMEAMKKGVAGYDVEHFYYLARSTLVKDERFLDRFDLGAVAVFSSEMRTFTRLPGGPPEPDPLGVARYLL